MLTASAAGTTDKSPARSALSGDLLAGITSGVVALPQGMAYAIIAGVPPEYGLYAMLVPALVAVAIRRSPFVITGATNTSGLVIGAVLATLLRAQPGLDPLGVMLLIVLLMGLLQTLAGVLRLGSIGRYVSKAVLIGFTFGAALLLIAGQLKNVLGLSGPAAVLLIDELRNVVSAVGAIKGHTLVVAAVTLAVVWACARVWRLLPGALLGLAFSAVLVQVLGWHDGPVAVALLAAIPQQLPQPTLPAFSWDLLGTVAGPSLALALLGMVEVISIGKALHSQAHLRFDADRELAALGMGNIAGAFFAAIPSSGSWTRSALNLQLGARTRWAGAISAGVVLLFIIALAPLTAYIPKAALGAVIIWIAVQMFDFKAARSVWAWSRKDGAVMLITAGAILFMEVQYAIYLGVVASLLLLLHSAARLHMVEMLDAGGGRFREVEVDERTGRNPLLLLQLEGDLFFGVVDELETRLERIAANGARVIIIRLKRTHGLDATATEALSLFIAHYKASGGQVIICGLKPEMYAQIRRSNLEAVIGAENLLPAEANNFDSVRKALEIGRKHLGQGEVPVLRVEGDLQQAWSYAI